MMQGVGLSRLELVSLHTCPCEPDSCQEMAYRSSACPVLECLDHEGTDHPQVVPSCTCEWLLLASFPRRF